MFPFVYGFSWSVGEIIFLGAFFTILTIIAITLITTIKRSIHTARTQNFDALKWRADFHELSAASRTCRHEFTGEFKHRICDNEFNCNECETHAKLVAFKEQYNKTVSQRTNSGFTLPLDRMYHRGHTWIKKENDGTFLVGVDDFASRMIGKSNAIELPPVGTKLSINGTAWNFIKNNSAVRILAPVEGEVVETSDGSQGWFLRVKPFSDKIKTGHLLTGNEARAWIQREFERLQNLLADPNIGLTMPDGGMPIEDFTKAYPKKNWEKIYSDILLEP